MTSSEGKTGRRVGRRGLAAFFGFIGVFLMADASLDTRDAYDLQERRIEAKRRATEAQLKDPAMRARSEHDRAKLKQLERQLYGILGSAAVALLLSLVIAISGSDPRFLALGLGGLGIAVVVGLGIVAPVLPLFVAAFVAQVPDSVWDPRRDQE